MAIGAPRFPIDAVCVTEKRQWIINLEKSCNIKKKAKKANWLWSVNNYRVYAKQNIKRIKIAKNASASTALTTVQMHFKIYQFMQNGNRK